MGKMSETQKKCEYTEIHHIVKGVEIHAFFRTHTKEKLAEFRGDAKGYRKWYKEHAKELRRNLYTFFDVLDKEPAELPW